MIEQKLETGNLIFHKNTAVKQEIGCYSPHVLFDLAERINPKRSFLFVSKLLMRHIPCNVENHPINSMYKAVGETLFQHTQEDRSVLILSMAETATQIGPRIAEYIPKDVMLVNSTRNPIENAEKPILCCFSEEHSHAVSHYIQYQGKLDVDTLILVDDEYSTGKTLLNAMDALWQAGLMPKKVITFAFLDWRTEVGLIAKKYGVKEMAFCLHAGEFEFISNGKQLTDSEAFIERYHFLHKEDGLITDSLKLGVSSYKLKNLITNLLNLGYFYPDKLIEENQRILILAAGENHYEAWLFANCLVKKYPDHYIAMGSMTRSPILAKDEDNYPIRSKEWVTLNGERRYLYNTKNQYDKVFLYFSPDHIEVLE